MKLVFPLSDQHVTPIVNDEFTGAGSLNELR